MSTAAADDQRAAAALAPLCHILSPVGMLGYGLDEAQTAAALAALAATGVPTALILDAGSTDSGPARLALGTMGCPRSAYVRDLAKLLRLVDVHAGRVPLIFSSAGGDGSDEHVREMEAVVAEIAAMEENRHYRLKVVSIFSGISKAVVRQRLRAGRITGCGVSVPALHKQDIDSASRIVAQIGPEPFAEALEADPDLDVLIGGRAYDPAPYVGYCLFQLKRQHPNFAIASTTSRDGQPLAGFTHMGKVMECGGLCATPKSHGAVATVYPDGAFDVRPLLPAARCTPVTVAAHSFYENPRPDVLRGPGGSLHLDGCTYEQLADGRTVRVWGSRFVAVEGAYALKLEGARCAGYRSMFMGTIKDYILISQIDELLVAVKKYVAQQHAGVDVPWDLDFHVHGRGHTTSSGPGELFVIGESLAPSQELAASIASKARIGVIHGPYPGQKATSGNLGFGIGGRVEMDMGQCAEFCVYHLMELDKGEERLSMGNADERVVIRSETRLIGRGAQKPAKMPDSVDIPSAVVSTQDTNSRPGRHINPSTAMPSQPTTPKTLSDLAHVLRSKNAGPYEISIDVMFSSASSYRAVKESNLLTLETITQALGVSADDILWAGYSDAALAFKVTIPRIRRGRRVAAGGFMEDDVHGSQQHNGFARIELPQALLASLGEN